MAAVEIHIPPIARTSGSVVCTANLDGRDYALRLQWNARAGTWALNLADSEGALIVAGVALVTGWALIELVTDARRPPGELIVWRSDGQGEHPGLADLGTTCKLYYYEAAS